MNKINIDEDHKPEDATFWASFAEEIGYPRKCCPTLTLYENKKGEFFVVREPPEDDTRGSPMQYVPIEDHKEWLQEEIKRLEGYLT